MIAVDTLVHNFLHRTGILRTFRASHSYGGCFAVLDAIAHAVDASQFHPACFPRFIQFAIWHFCAAHGRAVCNERNIDDTRRCQLGNLSGDEAGKVRSAEPRSPR
jgi:hypothetical protein